MNVQGTLFDPSPVATGVLWVVAGGRRVGLAVDAGRVVRAVPPFLGRWAVGKTLAWVKARHPQSQFTAGVEVFHYQIRHDARRLRRWQHPGHIPSKETDVLLGRVGDGRWWVAQTGQGGLGWIYPTVAGVVAEVDLRLAGPGWRRVPANYDRTGQPTPDARMPELADLDMVWPAGGG